MKKKVTVSIILTTFFAALITSPFTTFYILDTKLCRAISHQICFGNFDDPICLMFSSIFPFAILLAVLAIFFRQNRRAILLAGLGLIIGFVLGGYLFLRASNGI